MHSIEGLGTEITFTIDFQNNREAMPDLDIQINADPRAINSYDLNEMIIDSGRAP